MPASRWCTLLLLPALMTAATVDADIVKLPERPPEVLRLADEPSRGMTKQQVEARFGSPTRATPQVGDPPISSWDYDRYTVYFEGDYVLHTVVHSD